MLKGKFKFLNSNGIPQTYVNGDIVSYQGKIYKATQSTQQSPLQDPSSWIYLNNSEPYKGSSPPVNPKENQIWISDSGLNYIYYFDGDSYQWIGL